MQRFSTVVLLPVVALALAACGGSSGTSGAGGSQGQSSGATASTTTVKVATIKPFGRILVDSNGHALYVFAPDRHARVTCTGACAGNWPPLMLHGAKATAGTGVERSLLGSDPDPSGGRVITYAGWPLYAYILDSSAGEVNGQALDLNGGYWYVITPAGKVITTKG